LRVQNHWTPDPNELAVAHAPTKDLIKVSL